jgi:hypothetical protein
LCFAASSDDSNLEEVQLDDNGNNGSSQDVEETQEGARGKEKGSREECNVEDCRKNRTVEECHPVRPFIDTNTADKSEPLENLQIFHVEEESGRSQNGNGNRNIENLSDTNVRKEDEATFIIDGQNLNEEVNAVDEAKQMCAVDNCDVIGHLCSDEDAHCRRADRSTAGVQNHGSMKKNDAELVLNSTCKSRSRMFSSSEWQECCSGNQLIVVNQGHGGAGSVLRQGRRERLCLKWRLQQQVSPQDWISLSSLSEYHHCLQHKSILIIGLCILLRVYQSRYIGTSVRNKCRCSFYCAHFTLHVSAPIGGYLQVVCNTKNFEGSYCMSTDPLLQYGEFKQSTCHKI